VPGVKQLYADPPHLVRGQAQFLYDESGKQYLDMFGGIVTVSVGHCHPKVTERTIAQLQTLQHTSTSFMTNQWSDLAEKLAQISPGDLSKLSSPIRAARQMREPSVWLAWPAAP